MEYIYDPNLDANLAREAFEDLASIDFQILSNENMVEILRDASIDNPFITQKALDSILALDRADFFGDMDPAELEKIAYMLNAPPGQNGRTIPSAHIVLEFASYLDLKDGQKILGLQPGTGYLPAVMALTAGVGSHIYATETDSVLAGMAKERIARYDLQDRVSIFKAEQGQLGLPNNAPYDRIFTNACFTRTSEIESLLDQLVDDGMMMVRVAKVGNTPKKSQSRLWQPGEDVPMDEIYLKDPQRNLVRAATYIFKRSNDAVGYAATVKNCLAQLY